MWHLQKSSKAGKSESQAEIRNQGVALEDSVQSYLGAGPAQRFPDRAFRIRAVSLCNDAFPMSHIEKEIRPSKASQSAVP